jgi:hypothetical protein
MCVRVCLNNIFPFSFFMFFFCHSWSYHKTSLSVFFEIFGVTRKGKKEKKQDKFNSQYYAMILYKHTISLVFHIYLSLFLQSLAGTNYKYSIIYCDFLLREPAIYFFFFMRADRAAGIPFTSRIPCCGVPVSVDLFFYNMNGFLRPYKKSHADGPICRECISPADKNVVRHKCVHLS